MPSAGPLGQSKYAPEIFTGLFRLSNNVQAKMLIFNGQTCAYFGQECVADCIDSNVHGKVGRPGVDREALCREFGLKRVLDADKAWGTLFRFTSHIPTVNQIAAAGSPIEIWPIFKMFYALKAGAEKARLTQAWYKFRTRSTRRLGSSLPDGPHSGTGLPLITFRRRIRKLTTISPETCPLTFQYKRASCPLPRVRLLRNLKKW